MQSVLRCVTLCVILAIALSFDSEESNESSEDIFLNRFRANTFINSHGRNIYRRGVKSPAELRSEICENFRGCRVMARQYGPQLAYQRFFNGHQRNRNNHYRY